MPEAERQDDTLARLDRAAPPTVGDASRTPDDVAKAAAFLASEKKAERPLVLSVSELTSYADFFVIVSAPSERQVNAIAKNVEDELRRRGIKPMGSEGANAGNWLLLDFGDVIVHIFTEEARDYYDLEGFWADAERLDVDDAAGKRALDALSP